MGTRIFGSRVDANDIELKRICSNLCGGREEADDEDSGKQQGDDNYGGNDSVLNEMKEAKKEKKGHSKKAVIEEDNAKLTAPLDKRTKANPLMRGKRSALAAGGISEGLASVLLLPSLPVMEVALNKENKTATSLRYVVSEKSDRMFGKWIGNIVEQKPESKQQNDENKPRWSFDELAQIDISKEICPPLHNLDMNKQFGCELEGVSSTEHVSSEEAANSGVFANSDDNIRAMEMEGVRVDGEMAADDSFEMPCLEDRSVCDPTNDQTNEKQDMMLLIPMDDQLGTSIGQTTQNSQNNGTFSIEQLSEMLAKTLATETATGEIGNAKPPNWLLEQLVNGTVGKALKIRKTKEINKTDEVPKPRKNIVKVQKVAFGEDLHQAAEEKLTAKKPLNKSSKKLIMSSITGEHDLPEPLISHEFDALLKKMKDLFIAGVCCFSLMLIYFNYFCIYCQGTATESFDNDEDQGGHDNPLADFGEDKNDVSREDVSFDIIDDDGGMFSGIVESLNKSRHESMIMQRNLDEITANNMEDGENKAIKTDELGEQLRNQVRNAANSLAAQLLTRRVDVKVAKTELWQSVVTSGPETTMNNVATAANERLKARNSAKQQSGNAPKQVLSPQMAFVCLLHLANEHVSFFSCAKLITINGFSNCRTCR